jgi:hypothetical protein
MVERFCFVRQREDESPARAAVAAHLRAVLSAAPGVDDVSAGVPADDSAASWDVSLVVRCADLATWSAVAALPTVRALFAEWLPARAQVIKAWTFEAA